MAAFVTRFGVVVCIFNYGGSTIDDIGKRLL